MVENYVHFTHISHVIRFGHIPLFVLLYAMIFKYNGFVYTSYVVWSNGTQAHMKEERNKNLTYSSNNSNIS